MPAYLEKNLQCLEDRDPVLKERLQWPSPDEYDLELVEGGAMPSLKRRVDTGEWRLLHSTRDPEKEANRWADAKTPQEPVYNLIILGAGLWYHVWALVFRLQGTLENLVIIEQSDAVTRKAFDVRDLTPIVANKNTRLLVDPSPSETRQMMNELLTTFSLDGVLVAEHEPSVGCAPEFYQSTRKIIDESLEAGEILLRTKVHTGGLIQENLVRNLPIVFSTPSAGPFQGILQAIPAFIVAAGPSLDRNRSELARIGNRGAIFAVDTTYPILRRDGVRSHISVTADPSPYNLAHFSDFPDLDDTTLFFAPSVYWEVLRKVEGRKVSLPLPFSKTLNLFPTAFGAPLYMKTGLNVAQTALNLASYLGCDPIVFVGLDLSFAADGGGTHASGAALRRTISKSSSPGKMVVELLGDGPKTEEFEPVYVAGNEGGEVPTSKFWLSYLRSIEQDVAACPARCINATEGGARIEGTEIMSLVQTVDEICFFDADITERLHGTVSTFIPPDPYELTTFWQEAEETLDMGLDKAKEGQSVINELDQRLAQGDVSQQEGQQFIDRISQIHGELIQDQKIYSYLDEAADFVLTPFLRKSSRPRGDASTPENLQKTADRYRAFFTGMEDVCSRFLEIVRETSSESPQSDFDFGGPVMF